MISFLQFHDNDTTLSVSELNSSDKIAISMNPLGNEYTFFEIELGVDEIRKLKKWVDEAIDVYEENK